MLRTRWQSAIPTLVAALTLSCGNDPFTVDDLNLTTLTGRFAAQSVDGATLPARVRRAAAGAAVSPVPVASFFRHRFLRE